MIFVFRKIIYDSTLIHQYESESDFVKDLPIKTFSPNEFTLWLTEEYSQYNYVYLPQHGRYYYMDILEYRNNTIHVKFTCDYGRTFGEVIASDFLMCEDSLDNVQAAHLPTGGHIMSDCNILYFPHKESSHRLNKSDADNVISLIKSGIVINFEDYEPETYTPEPPENDTPSEDPNDLQPVDPIAVMNQPE